MQLEKTPGTQQNEHGTAYLPKPLLPFGKRLPAKRVVHLPNITADPIRLQLLVGPPTPDAKVFTCILSVIHGSAVQQPSKAPFTSFASCYPQSQ